NHAEAAKWYGLAADQGFAPAQNALALLYYRGQGVRKDLGQAEHWVRKAAEQGLPRAQTRLAYLYEQGDGMPQDQSAAASWYQKAARSGDPIAQNNLAFMYEEGVGVERNLLQAYVLYSLAVHGYGPGKRRADAATKRMALAGSLTSDELAQAQRRIRDWPPPMDCYTGGAWSELDFRCSNDFR